MNITRIGSFIVGLIISSVLAAAPVRKAPTNPKKSPFPEIVIKSIKNLTPYNLLIVDRLSKNTIKAKIDAGETVDLHLKSTGLNKVVIMGSMSDVMEKKAQYVFKKLDDQGTPEPQQEVYLNIGLDKGGVNDGSGIIAGVPGSIVCKFFSAGKNGGCGMLSGSLKNSHCKTVEFDLVLYTNDASIAENIFRLSIDTEIRELQ